MKTRIEKIILRRCEMKIANPGTYTTGDKDPDVFPILIGEVSNGEQSGFGECVPTSILYEEGHIGRSGIDEWGILRKLSQDLIGKDCRILSNWIPVELKDAHDANGIVDVLDFGIHDLVGRIYDIPVSVLLGGGRKQVRKSDVVHVKSPEDMAEQVARTFKEERIRYYKLKPIGAFEEDRETLVKIREKTGGKVHVFSDPNYALKVNGPDEAIAYLKEMGKHGLEVCEDPIKADFEVYKHIKDNSPVKLMLDDPVRTFDEVFEVVKIRCADQINIHANWSGGFQAGIRKANVAALAGIGTMVGSTRYVGIGCAAYQILSSVLPIDVPCEQSGPTQYSVVKEPFEMVDGNYIIPDKPGLGVEVDLEKLESVTVETVEIS